MQIILEISDKAIDILKQIKKAGQAEFRDSQYESLEAYKESYGFKQGINTEKHYWTRNFCQLKDLKELECAGFIEHNLDSWHITFVVTELGDKVLNSLESGKVTINYN